MTNKTKTTFIELGKLAGANVVGACIIAYFVWLSQDYPAPVDPHEIDKWQVYRYFVFEIPKGTWLCMLLSNAASIINWICDGDWWGELRKGNIAVGIATAGLFIAIGTAVSKGL